MNRAILMVIGVILALSGMVFSIMEEPGYTAFYMAIAMLLYSVSAMFLWAACKPPKD